mmetsp:Transcript_29470/g.66019  ORF Transcript_29470/g.66019 Transcript_29470/m.66019 type:complete len:201 (+) Transcript_29470:413-1015(+)
MSTLWFFHRTWFTASWCPRARMSAHSSPRTRWPRSFDSHACFLRKVSRSCSWAASNSRSALSTSGPCIFSSIFLTTAASSYEWPRVSCRSVFIRSRYRLLNFTVGRCWFPRAFSKFSHSMAWRLSRSANVSARRPFTTFSCAACRFFKVLVIFSVASPRSSRCFAWRASSCLSSSASTSERKKCIREWSSEAASWSRSLW